MSAWASAGLAATWLALPSSLPLRWPTVAFALLGGVLSFFITLRSGHPTADVFLNVKLVIGLSFSYTLPVLAATGSSALFVVLEVLACFWTLCLLNIPPTSDESKQDWAVLGFWVVLGHGLPAAALSASSQAAWTCANWAWMCQAWPWPLLCLPLLLGAAYLLQEFVAPLLRARGCRAAPTTLGDVLARLLLLLALAAAPVILQVDLESAAPKIEMPDINPAVYVKLNLSEAQKVNITKHALQWLSRPRPMWPTAEELRHLPATRTDYWATFMLAKFLLVLGASALLLRIGRAPAQAEPGARHHYSRLRQDEEHGQDEEREESGRTLSDHSLDLLAWVLVPTWLAICTKVCLSAGQGGQLTGAGMAWEGYDLLLTAGLAFFLLQAITLRAQNCRRYGAVDVAVASLRLWPFLGDAFDSLKDAMLASVAIFSETGWVRCAGRGFRRACRRLQKTTSLS